ncbi:unnamed protein product [Schistosoma turkestanicum]|nr:unnamed protein product [Schistosoma turkestanicum]
MYNSASASSASSASSSSSSSSSSADTRQPHSPIRLGYLIRVGESLNLTCPGDAVFYQWNLIDQPLQILSEEQFYVIKSATLKDSNRYICHAVDGYGRSSVEMSVRVLDFSSITAQHECAVVSKTGSVNINGPCFLTSFTEKELNPIKSWGDHILFDCDAVMTESDGSLDNLIYQWEFTSNTIAHVNTNDNNNNNNNNNLRSVNQLSSTGSSGTSSGSDVSNAIIHRQRLLVRTASMNNAIAHSNYHKSNKIDLSQFHESQLRIDKLTLEHNGEYRCTVRARSTTTGGAGAAAAGALSATINNYHQTAPLITRQFRLTVKSRTDGSIIEGPHITNETVQAGQDAIFHCKVNPEEHRSSTIRWGKSIDMNERFAYEAEGREVIQWAGGTFVVLPSVPTALALNSNPSRLSVLGSATSSSSSASSSSSSAVAAALPSGAVATEVSPSQSSQLVLRKASQSDSGRYVCSVLTEAGRDDHKFVQISVVGGSSIQSHQLIETSGPHRLTLYIAIPTTIFFICLCVVTYCLISRRTTTQHRRLSNLRQQHQHHQQQQQQRNYFNAIHQSQIKSPSITSHTGSIGVYPNGVNMNGTTNTTTINNNNNNINTNNSNHHNGSMNTHLPTANFPINLHGTIPMISGGYPTILIQQPQSQSQQQSLSNSLPTYHQSVPASITTGNNNHNHNNSNNLACYTNGLIYPLPPNGSHIIHSNLTSNSMFNSSTESPTSGINTNTANNKIEPVEGRLMFHPQSAFISNQYHMNDTFRHYDQSNGIIHTTTTNYDITPTITTTNTPSSLLLSYPNHTST